MRWPAERCQDALDGLLVLARAAMVSTTPERVPGVVMELMEALESAAMSETGPAHEAGGSIGAVGMVTPDEAGRATGLTGKHVRRLCSAGLVRHDLVGAGRYLVDLPDLQRHLGRAS